MPRLPHTLKLLDKPLSAIQTKPVILGLGLSLIPSLSQASLTSDFMLGQYTSEIEVEAAEANQAVYEDLKANNGCLDADTVATQPSTCKGLTFKVWSNIRELVHTANNLSRGSSPVSAGPEDYNMGIDAEKLGFALRWTAAEEFSTQNDLTESFINNSLTGLESRVSAIRSGARGFILASSLDSNNPYSNYLQDNPELLAAYLQNSEQAMGGSAGEGELAWSPWGGFLNISHTWGDKAPSQREAAYDFDGFSINLGFDYRVNESWVVGTTLAFSQERVDFDSSQSIVDGEVEMNAFSIMPFFMLQNASWFVLGSVGYQQSDFETERVINYGTNNALSSATDTTAISDNKADATTATLSAGYYWIPPEYPRFAFEPYISANYNNTKVDAYSEDDIQDDGFNFYIEEQDLKSLETSFGMKAQLTFTPKIGVIIPYIEGQWIKQHETDQHTISASYQEVNDSVLNPDASFELNINPADERYSIYTFGLSSVLMGSKQNSIEGGSTGGIQAFFSYSVIKGIAFYSQEIVTLGARYEF